MQLKQERKFLEEQAREREVGCPTDTSSRRRGRSSW